MKAAVPILLTLTIAIGCRSPVPGPALRDPEMAKLARTAALTHRYLSAERAIPIYRAALARAHALGDPAAGPLAYNLAVCMAEAGHLAEARRLVREAVRDLERAGASTAPARLLEFMVAMQEGDPDTAALADVTADAIRRERRRDLRADFHALLAEWALRNGRDEEALRALAEAGRNTRHAGTPASLARVHRVRGTLLLRHGHPADAATEFSREARAWGEAGLARRVADALERAAQAAEAAGDLDRAASLWFDAARARAALGAPAVATAHAERVLSTYGEQLSDDLRASFTHAMERWQGPAASKFE